jgi:hypothetical protein
MDVINIKGTDDTPNVILDKASGQFEISGRSLPEDVTCFMSKYWTGLMNMQKIPTTEQNLILN